MLKKLLVDKDIIGFILSKGGIIFAFRMIAMALSFLSMWFINHFYGEAVFGSYTIALTVLQIVAVVFALGIPNAFVGFTGEFDADIKSKGLLIKVSKIVLVVSSFPILFISFGASFFSEVLFKKPNLYTYFLILGFSVPFMILHEIICYYFISIKKFVAYGLLFFILPNVLFMGLLAIFYKYNLTEYFIFLAYVSSILITVIIGFVAIFHKKEKIIYPTISFKGIINKSFPMMLSGVFLILLNWTDILMLGRIENESQIGIYNTAFKIGYLTLFFVVSMNVLIMPKVSELYYKNNIAEMKKVINRITQLVIILTIPLAVTLIFFSELILKLFGPGFVAGKNTLILITIGSLFNAMTGNVDQILNMTNHQKIVKNIFFLGFLLNVILNIFLIPKYGIEGAATSSLITNIVVNIVFVIIIKKKLGFLTFM
ncbi:O-antigen/teichoic acid export membrane protein [Flavobacterium sp. CG_23.5]|uniref:flippase n=1 Tax=Flavobacterium sp. CG_23.5 TaxID=2760708 RepID=UPI001AE5B525|nr:flippase [Flavobacterium sp. CG_23.5]MBP2283630.1 O-antigen/teichoic acid export membrane protein [Flavobacterium sp. CG_23.5]